MLGPLEVHADSGDVLEVGGARLRALLILLALDPGRVVTSGRLIDALWEDQVPAGATNALQALVSRLRRAVPGTAILPHPAGYRLDLDPDAVDVRRFERLAALGRNQLRHDPGSAAATLRDALALWRGPALADVADMRFAREPVARLEERRLGAVQDRIEAELRLGAAEALVPELEALVVAHPLREPLVGQLMRALHAAGRPGAALVAYEQLRCHLADQLGVDPSADLVALHTALLRSAPAAAGRRPVEAPTDGGAVPRTNLRTALTTFVGRDRELSTVARLLQASRLTTLTGPGGAGKTRLAIEAARAELDSATDGVWLVELAPVTDAGEVAPTALAALGLRDQAVLSGPLRGPGPEAADPLGRLVAALSGKSALLVLDNCEHLVAAAATLADRVLGTCPRVRIVATSREPLGIAGETLWPVEPLSLPPAGADPATAVGYAAVRLLADRARAVRPDFAVHAGNADAVVRICRALDGMPLAIELAAARLRVMTPQELADRLADRFRLLTGGSRTALPRHQTLRAVVDWSWELLDEPERALLRRLSVFAGGATLAAAEQVCAGGAVAADDVLDLLTALVDKSLLVVRQAPGGSRYGMLETIRAYGLERLAEAGERESLRTAHARHFLCLAETAEPQLRNRDQLRWLERLAADHDNLQAAVRAAIAAGDAPTAVRLVCALGWYWWLRGHRVEGAELATAAVRLPDPPADEEGRALAYAIAALLTVEGPRDTGMAVEWFRRAAELSARLTHPQNPLLRLVLPLHAVLAAVQVERAEVPLDVLDRLTDDPDTWTAATARVMRAHMRLNFGRMHADAEDDFTAALAGYRGVGEHWGTAFAQTSLGGLQAWRGEYRAALQNLGEGLRLIRELGIVEEQVQFRSRIAQLHHLLGDRERAWAELAEAHREAQRIGLVEARYHSAYMPAELARREGDAEVAARFAAEAAALVEDPAAAPQARAVVATLQGYLATAAGDLAAARRHHARALANAARSVDAPVVAGALVGIADLAMAEGDPAWAATLLAASVAVRGTEDRSLPDAARLAAAAREAVGAAAFGQAWRRGEGTTVGTAAQLVGDLTPEAGQAGPALR